MLDESISRKTFSVIVLFTLKHSVFFSTAYKKSHENRWSELQNLQSLENLDHLQTSRKLTKSL